MGIKATQVRGGRREERLEELKKLDVVQVCMLDVNGGLYMFSLTYLCLLSFQQWLKKMNMDTHELLILSPTHKEHGSGHLPLYNKKKYLQNTYS